MSEETNCISRLRQIPYMILFLLFVPLLFSCSGNDCSRNQEMNQWMQNSDKIKVLTTTAMISDLVKKIGKEHTDTYTLIKEELDPHSYQLVKGDDEKFARAQVIFYNGLGLEHGPSLQSYLESHDKAIALGNRIFEDDKSLLIKANNQVDPHIWMDISLWVKTVPVIVDVLSVIDPQNKADYQKNGDVLINEMMATHNIVFNMLQAIPPEKRFLVTSHDAFNYFARAYLATADEKKQNQWQKRFAAPEGLAPESQLSASDIQAILDHLKLYNIEVIFPESNVSKDSLRKILSVTKEMGLNVRMSNGYLYGDAMGHTGTDGDTYLNMIQHNARILTQNLNGS